MKLEKGMLITVDHIWYVAISFNYDIETRVGIVWCVCDNANNIYTWDLGRVTHYMTLKDVAEEKRSPIDREIPHDVIVEVLSGRHDGRVR